MDILVTDTSKYGVRLPCYSRPNGTYYVLLNGRQYERTSADDRRALRDHILDVWRPVDSAGQSLYRQMAAQPNWNVWTQ